MKTLILICSILFGSSIFAGEIEQWRTLLEQKKAVGLDVRTYPEVKLNAAEGAKHLSLFDFDKDKIKQLKIDKKKAIFVFCESGNRAGKAVPKLKAAGYENVINIKDWRTWNKITAKK